MNWKPKCWYSGTTKCYGKMGMISDENAARSGHSEGVQSDPSDCKWLKDWIYCPYVGV
jgi:hypothetical protein